jgi:DtxR family Mn-dependent transcriptional regulator
MVEHQGAFSFMEINTKLTATLEDYLITVCRIEREKRVARPRDIARRQKVARSTVTSALRSLAGMDLINYEPYEAVTLTAKGRKQAETLIIRNLVLRDFLEGILGFSSEEAQSTTCGMEHALDSSAVERFVSFLAFIRHSGIDGPRWLEEFRECMRAGGQSKPCVEYVQEYLRTLKKADIKSGDADTQDSDLH